MNKARRAVLGSVLIAAAFTVTACGGSSAADPEPQVTVTATETRTTGTDPTDEATAPSSDAITRLSVEIAWEQQSEHDKQAMCDGIQLFGKDFAVSALRQGMDDNPGNIDVDLAADLIEKKCDKEGY